MMIWEIFAKITVPTVSDFGDAFEEIDRFEIQKTKKKVSYWFVKKRKW